MSGDTDEQLERQALLLLASIECVAAGEQMSEELADRLRARLACGDSLAEQD